MQELVTNDGIVIVGSSIPLMSLCLKAIRRIEPKRNLIVVLEDIDEIIRYNGEAGVLSLLDGEDSIDNVLTVASTNHPELLGARIINRPSRFDRRIYVPMPSAAARLSYLQQATGHEVAEDVLQAWVADTTEMSIAHLRELVAAVYCLEQPYADVIERLRAMSNPVKAEDGFKQKSAGFGGLSKRSYEGQLSAINGGG